ncbi:MAG TPA: sialidase family protein [Polyangiaceae bacterium]|nr:sialidase family protein [Polyangiaceae bacterium]
MTGKAVGIWGVALLVFACSSGSGGGGAADSGIGGSGSFSGTGNTAGNGATAGAAGSGASAGFGASAGSGGGAGSGGSGAGPSGVWTVIENSSLYGVTALTGHPTDPNSIAILIDQSPSAPGLGNSVVIATSTDSGKTLSSTKIIDVPKDSYIDGHGLVWHPKDAQKIATAFGFPYGFDFSDLWRFASSADGGKSFQLQSLVHLEKLVWNAGALVALVDGKVRLSTDFGTNFTSVQLPSGCTAAAGYAKSGNNDVFACGKDGVVSCQGTICSAVAVPGATTVYALGGFATDPSRLVALGGNGQNSEVYQSTDGGKTFNSVQQLPKGGSWWLQLDPRDGGKTVVVNDRASGHAVWRSNDAGATFSDVTPSPSLPNTPGLSTYAYEVGITAGGGIVAYTAAGILRLDP